jgi:hypothetical protein
MPFAAGSRTPSAHESSATSEAENRKAKSEKGEGRKEKGEERRKKKEERRKKKEAGSPAGHTVSGFGWMPFFGFCSFPCESVSVCG